MAEDYYKILSVEPTATQKEIEDAAEKLLFVWSERRGLASKKRSEILAQIRDARNVLTDPLQRYGYDIKYGFLKIADDEPAVKETQSIPLKLSESIETLETIKFPDQLDDDKIEKAIVAMETLAKKSLDSKTHVESESPINHGKRRLSLDVPKATDDVVMIQKFPSDNMKTFDSVPKKGVTLTHYQPSFFRDGSKYQTTNDTGFQKQTDEDIESISNKSFPSTSMKPSKNKEFNRDLHRKMDDHGTQGNKIIEEKWFLNDDKFPDVQKKDQFVVKKENNDNKSSSSKSHSRSNFRESSTDLTKAETIGLEYKPSTLRITAPQKDLSRTSKELKDSSSSDNENSDVKKTFPLKDEKETKNQVFGYALEKNDEKSDYYKANATLQETKDFTGQGNLKKESESDSNVTNPEKTNVTRSDEKLSVQDPDVHLSVENDRPMPISDHGNDSARLPKEEKSENALKKTSTLEIYLPVAKTIRLEKGYIEDNKVKNLDRQTFANIIDKMSESHKDRLGLLSKQQKQDEDILSKTQALLKESQSQKREEIQHVDSYEMTKESLLRRETVPDANRPRISGGKRLSLLYPNEIGKNNSEKRERSIKLQDEVFIIPQKIEDAINFIEKTDLIDEKSSNLKQDNLTDYATDHDSISHENNLFENDMKINNTDTNDIMKYLISRRNTESGIRSITNERHQRLSLPIVGSSYGESKTSDKKIIPWEIKVVEDGSAILLKKKSSHSNLKQGFETAIPFILQKDEESIAKEIDMRRADSHEIIRNMFSKRMTAPDIRSTLEHESKYSRKLSLPPTDKTSKSVTGKSSIKTSEDVSKEKDLVFEDDLPHTFLKETSSHSNINQLSKTEKESIKKQSSEDESPKNFKEEETVVTCMPSEDKNIQLEREIKHLDSYEMVKDDFPRRKTDPHIQSTFVDEFIKSRKLSFPNEKPKTSVRIDDFEPIMPWLEKEYIKRHFSIKSPNANSSASFIQIFDIEKETDLEDNIEIASKSSSDEVRDLIKDSELYSSNINSETFVNGVRGSTVSQNLSEDDLNKRLTSDNMLPCKEVPLDDTDEKKTSESMTEMMERTCKDAEGLSSKPEEKNFQTSPKKRAKVEKMIMLTDWRDSLRTPSEREMSPRPVESVSATTRIAGADVKTVYSFGPDTDNIEVFVDGELRVKIIKGERQDLYCNEMKLDHLTSGVNMCASTSIAANNCTITTEVVRREKRESITVFKNDILICRTGSTVLDQ